MRLWRPRPSTRGAPGFDLDSGFGLIQADQALATLVGAASEVIVYVPRFKGSKRPRRFFGLKALHTTRGRDLAHDTPAGGEAGDHRCAAPLAHLSTIGPVLLGQTRPTLPPLLGWRSGLCSLGAAGHGRGGRDGPGAGSRCRPTSPTRSASLTPRSVRASPAIRGQSPRDS